MAEFFNMGGYAFFVWTSYIIVAVLFAYQFFYSISHHKKLISQLGAEVDPKTERTQKT